MSSASMAKEVQSANVLIFVWVLTGVMTLFGALTQCELVAQMPSTGGLYRYLHDIYGKPVGFFYGWANFTIAGSGAIAALAFIFASFLSEFVPMPHLSEALEKWPVTIPYVGAIFPLADLGMKAVGAALILLLTFINIRGVRLGALVQSFSTSAKVVAILALIAAAYFYTGQVNPATAQVSSLHGFSLLGAVIAAMSSAFWAYDGWGNVSYIAGEVHNPEKTLPRAIVLGTVCFIGLYILINLAYLHVLSISEIAQAPGERVASAVMVRSLGTSGAALISILIILSTFDTTNSTILTNGRVYYAMAKDHLFAQPAEKIHERFDTPYISLIWQGLWSIMLLVSGSFDLVIGMYVFVNWLLYLLMALGVFILRFRFPERHRPFKTPGYPVVPFLFILFSAGFVGLTLYHDISDFNSGKEPIIKSLMGLLLVATGFPFYLFWNSKKQISDSTKGL